LADPAAGRTLRRGRPRPIDAIIRVLLVLASLVSVATTIAILVALIEPAIEFFSEVNVVRFLTEESWGPQFATPSYGILPLLAATVEVTAIALVIAIPLGIGSAIYLAEYASGRARKVLKPILELLAGVPTVVYGFIALAALSPLLRQNVPGFSGLEFQNMLVAGIAMGVMIVPTIASISEDAMSAVPHSLREGAYALASSKMQVATRVVVPAAVSGIVAAIVLGVSRAIGETMIVAIAGGLTSDSVDLNPLHGAATMTAYIAAIAQGDVPVGTVDYNSIFAVGVVLFTLTFVLNVFSIRLVRKFREVYE
jgi:phosphate transport system permease protein